MPQESLEATMSFNGTARGSPMESRSYGNDFASSFATSTGVTFHTLLASSRNRHVLHCRHQGHGSRRRQTLGPHRAIDLTELADPGSWPMRRPVSSMESVQ